MGGANMGLVRIAALLLPAIAVAQTFSFVGAPSSAVVGQPLTFQVQVTAPAGGWGAVGWTLTVTGATISGAVIDPSVGDGKDLDCTPDWTSCLAVGSPLMPTAKTQLSAIAVTSTTPVADYTITPTGAVTLTLIGASMGTTAGINVPSTRPGTITIPLYAPNLCAVSGDGTPSLTDVQDQISWGLGITQPPAGTPVARIVTDTPPYAASAMIVLNAYLGNGCTATQ
jgi:hypothetical protein